MLSDARAAGLPRVQICRRHWVGDSSNSHLLGAMVGGLGSDQQKIFSFVRSNFFAGHCTTRELLDCRAMIQWHGTQSLNPLVHHWRRHAKRFRQRRLAARRLASANDCLICVVHANNYSIATAL